MAKTYNQERVVEINLTGIQYLVGHEQRLSSIDSKTLGASYASLKQFGVV